MVKTVFLFCAFALISFLNIISNSLLIYGLFKSKQLKNVSNRLIFAMSVSDLCLGVFALPIYAVDSIQNLESQAWILTAAGFMSNVFVYTSFQILFCVAVDRYIHITKRRLYRSDLNRSRLAILIMCCILIATGITTSYVFMASFWQHLAIIICNTIVISGLTVLYTVMFKHLQKHQLVAKTRIQQANSISNNNSSNIEARDGDSRIKQLSAVRTIRLVFMAIFICYLPYCIISTVTTFCYFQSHSQPGEVLQVLSNLSTLLVFCSSFINSVMIIFGNLRCRRVISSLFRKQVAAST